MSPAAPSKKFTCGICQKGFDTKPAKKQHAKAKHARPKATQTVVSASVPPVSVDSLNHRGIVYSNLSVVEQNALQSRLRDLCHSEQRLQKEGYSLPSSTATQSQPRSTPKVHLSCPNKNPSMPKTAAIVLDCEMAGAAGGQNELIQITMVDFLSGNVLQSCLVNPSRPIIDWREGITGISAVSMREAVAGNRALHGWEAARAELWRFADKETIIIGQSVHNDLKVLRTSHTRIIDSAILSADAVLGKKSKIRKRWGLETLCSELLGIQIRKPYQKGGRGVHDALEDALATREVVLLCARQPGELKRWATPARAAFFNRNSSRQTAPRAGGSQPVWLSRGNTSVREYEDEDEDEDEDEELLKWEDVVEWEIWPKSPPDWDY